MGLKIANRLFSGPYDMAKFRRRKNQSAVIYAIISKSGPSWDPNHHLVAVDTHGDEGLDFTEVAEAADWPCPEGGSLCLFVDFLDNHKTTAETRRKIVDEIRQTLDVPGAFIPIA